MAGFVLLSVSPNVLAPPDSTPVLLKLMADYLYGISLHTSWVVGAISIVCAAYLHGDTILRGALVLFLLLNPRTLPFLLSGESLVLVVSGAMRKTGIWQLGVLLPSISPLAYGSVICECISKRSFLMLPVAFSLACISHGVSSVPEIPAPLPLLSSTPVPLSSKGCMLRASGGTYGKGPGEKQGSGNRRVFASGPELEIEEWRIYLAGKIENPVPATSIHSGDPVLLQHVSSGCYLETSDIASPLTQTNQEVSCASMPGDNSMFLLLKSQGSRQLGQILHKNDSFYIKHAVTGVFIMVLKRKSSDGFEVNGEKPAGRDKYRGPKSAVWMVGAPQRAPLWAGIKRVPAAALRMIRAYVISVWEKRSSASQGVQMNGVLCIYLFFFSVAAVRSFRARTVIREILEDACNLIIAYTLRGSKVWIVCLLFITGIKYGTGSAPILKAAQ